MPVKGRCCARGISGERLTADSEPNGSVILRAAKDLLVRKTGSSLTPGMTLL